MRIVLGVIAAALAFGAGCGAGLAQAPDVPALASIHMLDALTGWAVTGEREAGRILRTRDGGLHWRDVTPRASSGKRVGVVNATELTALMAWVATDGHIYRTVDGGQTWRSLPVYVGSHEAVGGFQFANPLDGWLLIDTGHWMANEAVDIYRTTDGGETWIKVATAAQYDQDAGLSTVGQKGGITFRSATTGWISGMEGVAHDVLLLYVSYDSGRTWRGQKLPVPSGVASPWFASTAPPTFFSQGEGILPVFYGLEAPSRWVAVFYATHDGGVTWTSTTPVSAAADWDTPYSFADLSHGWTAGNDVLDATDDGGRRWITIRPANWSSGVTALDFISPKIGWAVKKTSPWLLKTVDGGRTWAVVTYSVERP